MIFIGLPIYLDRITYSLFQGGDLMAKVAKKKPAKKAAVRMKKAAPKKKSSR